jgi:hypothetical protein
MPEPACDVVASNFGSFQGPRLVTCHALGKRQSQSWLKVAPACEAGPVSDQESSAICSARGCQATATWAVVWNNPRLHAPDREKIWVACDEHKQSLADFLTVRSFLKRVEPLDAG